VEKSAPKFNFSSRHHLILSLLAEKPMRPLDLMKTLTKITGEYASDFAVWNSLKQLLEIGAIEKEVRGKKRVYYKLTSDTLCTPDGVIAIRATSPPILSFICTLRNRCQQPHHPMLKESHGKDCPFFAELRKSGKIDELMAFTRGK